MVREQFKFYDWGWWGELFIWLSLLIFIIPTCIVVLATENDIKVVLDQEKVGNPWFKRTIPYSVYGEKSKFIGIYFILKKILETYICSSFHTKWVHILANLSLSTIINWAYRWHTILKLVRKPRWASPVFYV